MCAYADRPLHWHARSLLADIFKHLFLNFGVWIYAEVAVQKEVLQFLVVKSRERPLQIKQLFGVQACLDVIRLYYYTTSPAAGSPAGGAGAAGASPDESDKAAELQLHSVSKEPIGRRPSFEDSRRLRGLLLSLVQLFVEGGISLDETQALVGFLVATPVPHHVRVCMFMCMCDRKRGCVWL